MDSIEGGTSWFQKELIFSVWFDLIYLFGLVYKKKMVFRLVQYRTEPIDCTLLEQKDVLLSINSINSR